MHFYKNKHFDEHLSNMLNYTLTKKLGGMQSSNVPNSMNETTRDAPAVFINNSHSTKHMHINYNQEIQLGIFNSL